MEAHMALCCSLDRVTYLHPVRRTDHHASKIAAGHSSKRRR